MAVKVKIEKDGTIVVADDRKPLPKITPPWKSDGLGYAPWNRIAVHFGPGLTTAANQPSGSTKEIAHIGKIVEHVKQRPAGTGDDPLLFDWKGDEPPSMEDVVGSVRRSTSHPFVVRFTLKKA